MDHEARYARNAVCREGGLHAGTKVEDVFGEQVAHICSKCLDRVMPIVNPRMLKGWPRQTVFYITHEEAGVV